MVKPYLCPIPWVSLSLGARDGARLCCHQSGPTEQSGERLNLDHAENARTMMMAGKIPSECRSCVELESAGCRSPREDYLERFPFSPDSKPVIRYLDLTVDNDCNLECIMCSPLYSRKLFSFYETALKVVPERSWTSDISTEDLAKIIPTLEQVTLTGGEPFLSRKSISLIRQLAGSERAGEIVLRVFTNLSHLPADLLEDLNAFKKLELILSIDSVNENYEFMRFPAKWSVLSQNIQKLRGFRFKQLDLHQHTVITAVNWLHMGEILSFFAETFPESYNIIPVFVEIDAPGILHPRVLPDQQWKDGKERALKALQELKPKNADQQRQIDDFANLIAKMETKNHHDRFVDYQIYLQKVKAHRKERQPHGA